MSYDLVIKNGTLVHSNGRTEGNLGIRGETIEAITSPSESLSGAREIDASGKFVLPGRIDPHVHMHWPDWPMEEAIPTSSRAAVAGGTTTLIHFILSTGSLLEHFAEMRSLFDAHALSGRDVPWGDREPRITSPRSPSSPVRGSRPSSSGCPIGARKPSRRSRGSTTGCSFAGSARWDVWGPGPSPWSTPRTSRSFSSCAMS